MKPEGIVQVGVNGEQRNRGALSGSDNTLAGKRNTKREPRKASREHQNGSRGRHQNRHPSPLPHFSRGIMCESHTFFRGNFVQVSHIFHGNLL